MDWATFIIHTALGVITSVIKNPTKKAALKEYMLELRDAISAAFPNE